MRKRGPKCAPPPVIGRTRYARQQPTGSLDRTHPQFSLDSPSNSPRQTRENSSKTREKPSLRPHSTPRGFVRKRSSNQTLPPLPPAKQSSRNIFLRPP